MRMATVYRPEACWVGGEVKRGAELCVGDDGRVLATAPAGAEVVALPGRVLLPGFVNGHSHAFQRVLRGRTEFLAPGHERDDFWSWREAMYAAATTLSPDDLYVVSRQAFLEMALAGITTVGEFHYLHHQSDGTPYADEHELALRVISAARDVGLRIVLLRVVYARAGFQVQPNPRQQRFLDPDAATSLRRATELAARVARDPLVSVGLAPHSVRAVPLPWLAELSRGWPSGPLHMHVAEQPAEVKACLEEHQRRPVELLNDAGLLSERFTAVHAIHLERGEVERLARTGATVCACPSTERNLGDGVVPADELLAAQVPISLGSDSQAHIDLLDEARQLEGHLRLVRQRRNVLDPRKGQPEGLGRRLLQCLTSSGARSLGVNAGGLNPGESADFVTLSLAHPSLVGAPEGLEPALALGASSAAVRDVAVAGRLVVKDGHHAAEDAVARDFSACVRRLYG
ncbi:MAG: formimidoylglutamate deiminase [Myxococcota bacterium]